MSSRVASPRSRRRCCGRSRPSSSARSWSSRRPWPAARGRSIAARSSRRRRASVCTQTARVEGVAIGSLSPTSPADGATSSASAAARTGRPVRPAPRRCSRRLAAAAARTRPASAGRTARGPASPRRASGRPSGPRGAPRRGAWSAVATTSAGRAGTGCRRPPTRTLPRRPGRPWLLLSPIFQRPRQRLRLHLRQRYLTPHPRSRLRRPARPPSGRRRL